MQWLLNVVLSFELKFLTTALVGHFSSLSIPGRALVYPGAFDSFVTFTSQHCHFLSVISSSGKDNKFEISFVQEGQDEMVDPQYD